MVILLSVKEVMAVTGLGSRPYIWRRIKEGKFPAPVRISGDKKHRYFHQDQVIAWAAERAAKKRAQTFHSHKRERES